ncbi:glycosyltransferase [Roseiterribacter gracilis]|uniref:Glycosyl transferase n=1 Tax=Roseiterribacter gracilis TaxID=2812848 RepID=A0A8S8X6G5_9PROT|nr:glycosyl transferase [Rhodospirillales bacterium TMPK1]
MIWLALLSLVIWLYLLFARGDFWRLPNDVPPVPRVDWPEVIAVIPARNEEEGVAAMLRSLLAQRYGGAFRIVVVDDRSEDSTGAIVRAAATERPTRVELVTGTPRPDGWSGKLWAVRQGLDRAAELAPDARYVWLTDADIEHAPGELAELVARAERDELDLTSFMVRLRCVEPVERWLVPAFIFFFRKLYPFAWANDPKRATAAAAGGSMLLRRTALERIGGIESLRGALIDDCSLAAHVKGTGGRIWLGMARQTHSLRSYAKVEEVWNMVARTADAQLRHSLLLLAGTVAGMGLLYLLPPVATLACDGWTQLFAACAWLALSVSYVPMLRFYRVSPWWAPVALPAAALVYVGATIDSAWRHRTGKGGQWKGRTHGPSASSNT